MPTWIGWVVAAFLAGVVVVLAAVVLWGSNDDEGESPQISTSASDAPRDRSGDDEATATPTTRPPSAFATWLQQVNAEFVEVMSIVMNGERSLALAQNDLARASELCAEDLQALEALGVERLSRLFSSSPSSDFAAASAVLLDSLREQMSRCAAGDFEGMLAAGQLVTQSLQILSNEMTVHGVPPPS